MLWWTGLSSRTKIQYFGDKSASLCRQGTQSFALSLEFEMSPWFTISNIPYVWIIDCKESYNEFIIVFLIALSVPFSNLNSGIMPFKNYSSDLKYCGIEIIYFQINFYTSKIKKKNSHSNLKDKKFMLPTQKIYKISTHLK